MVSYPLSVQSHTSGIPPSFILCLLLFSGYMNPLTNISVSQDSVLLLYADDIVLYKLVNWPADIFEVQ